MWSRRWAAAMSCTASAALGVLALGAAAKARPAHLTAGETGQQRAPRRSLQRSSERAPAASATAPAPHWRTLTIHRAWLETVVGARGVRKRAHAYTDTVQHESACVRHSRYVVDCPFRYVIGSELAENFERCNDIGRVAEIAEDRFSFTPLSKPGCALINNETP